MQRLLDQLRLGLSRSKTSDPAWQGNEAAIAVAALLLEVAEMDGRQDETERARAREIIEHHFGDGEQVLQQAQIARAEATDLHPFTSRLCKDFSQSERHDLIRWLWDIVHADGHADDYELALMRRLAGLLYVPDAASGLARRQSRAATEPKD